MNFLIKNRKSLNNQRILYISYDGMLEPLGQSQVLAYLERLSDGRCICLISFEKTYDWADEAERKRIISYIAKKGIIWVPLRYHKWPSVVATAWDIICGITIGICLVLRYRLNIVHARSYVPSVMALAIKRIAGLKYVFDMRGFWADEKVDGGSWKREERLYRIAKWFERRFFIKSDHIVSLTYAGIREIEQFEYLKGHLPPSTIIPTCADLSRFSPSMYEKHKFSDEKFVLGYIGSVGTFYMFEEVVKAFAELQNLLPKALFLIVNRGQHDYIHVCLRAANIQLNRVEVTSATFNEMPRQIMRMNAGIFFIKPTFSKQASAPTKLAEFLGRGIPCLANAGVGDMAEVLEGEAVGVAIRSFDSSSIKRGLHRLLQLAAEPSTHERCIKAAHRYFSLDDGVEKYKKIYESLTK